MYFFLIKKKNEIKAYIMINEQIIFQYDTEENVFFVSKREGLFLTGFHLPESVW